MYTYKTFSLPAPSLIGNCDKIDALLNKAASEGWELVAVARQSNGSGSLAFMRKLAQ